MSLSPEIFWTGQSIAIKWRLEKGIRFPVGEAMFHSTGCLDRLWNLSNHLQAKEIRAAEEFWEFEVQTADSAINTKLKEHTCSYRLSW